MSYSYTGSPKCRMLSARDARVLTRLARVLGDSSWRGVAVSPICTAFGLRGSTSDHFPQAERWHSSMTMWLK